MRTLISNAVTSAMIIGLIACSSSSSNDSNAGDANANDTSSGDTSITTDAPKGDAADTSTTTDTPSTDTPSAPGFSGKYPGDLGIDKDPAVVWAENFEEGTVDAVVARYDDHKNTPGMTLQTDVPTKSGGKSSMKLVAGGATDATDFYKQLPDHDELWVRWYVKYQASGKWHHTGVWFGGYNPPIPYPNPQAGLKPNGDDRVSFSIEPVYGVGSPGVRLDTYDYWMNMHSWMDVPSGTTAYYGNATINQKSFVVDEEAWMCLEAHAKMNDDVASSKGAVLEVWKNDALVQHFDDSSPLGYWVKDKFCADAADGNECTDYRPAGVTLAPEDIQFRSTAALELNAFWPQNYVTDPSEAWIEFDDMIVATARIGCLR
jgi:hypothetical protein